MMMILTLASILGIAAAVWAIDKFLPIKICPICAGGFLTWTLLLVLHYIGYPIPLLIPAILMGGSVVGIMQQLDKRSPRSDGARMLFKALFMPTGFLAAYALVIELWVIAAASLGFLVGLSLWVASRGNQARETSEAEERLKECC